MQQAILFYLETSFNLHMITFYAVLLAPILMALLLFFLF